MLLSSSYPEYSLGKGFLRSNFYPGSPFLFLVAFLILTSCQSNQPVQEEERWWTSNDQQLIINELNRTTQEVRDILDGLTDQQWLFREDSTRWSIAEIIEHLTMQNLLHYREITVIARSPQYLELREITSGRDDYFSAYGTDATPGKSQWYLLPTGKHCELSAGSTAFFKAREELTRFVEETEADLRKQFTYRTPVEGKEIKDLKIGEVRDLHQLLLTGIGHTDRHLRQIRKLKQHPDYPD